MANSKVETVTPADLKNLESSIKDFIKDQTAVGAPAENFQKSWTGCETKMQKTRRILEILATAGGLLTPTVLLVNSYRGRRAARRAEAMDFVHVPSNGSDGIAVNL
tara:strand:- start:1026 stop:1343 length:318 start_codon:yes stop_codon:yes gene_type:complete